MLIDSSIWHSPVTISLWIPILHQAISILLEKNSLGESINARKMRNVMTPFSFHVLFTFIYSLRVKKQHRHFIFFGPFCTYSFSCVLALPQVLPFFYFYNSCSHVLSFIILFFFDSPWLPLTPLLTVLYSADCAFSSFTFLSFLHRRVLSFSFLYFSWLRHVLLSSYSSYY